MMDREVPESTLVERAKQGDHKAFEALIKPLIDKLHRKCTRAVGDIDKAEDVVQDTMINAYTKIHTFRGDSKFSTWVYMICQRCLLMHFRSEKRKGAKRLDDMSEPVMEEILKTVTQPIPDQVDVAIASQLADNVTKATEALHPKYYQVIDLWLSGSNLKEICALTDLTVPAAKTRIHRARQQIRSFIEEAHAA